MDSSVATQGAYSVALSPRAYQNASMTSDDVGHRCPDGAYEWTVERDGDEPLVIRHWAPDVVSHRYPRGGINEPILLYRGRFTTQADEVAPERACDGDIRMSWRCSTDSGAGPGSVVLGAGKRFSMLTEDHGPCG